MKLGFVYNDGGRSKYYEATNVGDCATRAIAIATGKDYKEVYKALSKIEGKPVRNGCKKTTDKKYLTELGWQWHPTMNIGQGCTTHLNADDLPLGTIICQVSGHLVAVIDHVVNDTYDCTRDGTRCVYGYWTMPEYKVDRAPKKEPKKARVKSKRLTIEQRVARLERQVKRLQEALKEKRK